MKVEIRNVKHHPDLSEETECFSADLHIDGKRIGSVSNRGTGGGDDCHGDHAAYDAADRWLLYTIRVRAPHNPSTLQRRPALSPPIPAPQS